MLLFKTLCKVQNEIVRQMVYVAFHHVHDVFNLVQNGGRYKFWMIPNQVIRIHFYHVLFARIAF